MDTLILLKAICEHYNYRQGSAVTTRCLMDYDPITSQWSRAKLYRNMSKLIDFGFVARVKRGFYVPVDIYQHEMEFEYDS